MRKKMSKRSIKYSYDPLSLIELIEQRPCLWDKTIKEYKDRVKKSKAWTEVYQFLIEDFENLQEKEKVEAGRAINDKWKHIRDAFATSLKKTSADKGFKKYKYFDELQFLLKILKHDVTKHDVTETVLWDNKEESEEEESSMTSQSTSPSPAPTPSYRKRSKISELDDTDKAILKAIGATYQPPPLPQLLPPQIDEDMAFFTSVTSVVKKFTEDEKLEFRMGVLTLIKQIKEKRNDGD